MEPAPRALRRFGGARRSSATRAPTRSRPHQIGAQATGRPARRARRLVPRPHARRALGHRTAGERAPFAPLVPGVSFATPATLADAVGAGHGRDLPRAGAGRGRRPPLAAGDARARARARRRARRDARLRRGADRHRPHGRVLRLGAARACGPTRVTLAKGLANGLPIGALLVADGSRPASFRATTPRPSAATPSPAPPPARSSTRSTTSCSPTSATFGARFEAALPGRPRLGPAPRGRARPPGAPGRRGRARAGPARRHRGRDGAEAHAPAHDHGGGGGHGDRDPAGGDRGDDEVRAAGRDPPARPAAAALDADRGGDGAPRARASTRCRRRSRATSPSSGS